MQDSLEQSIKNEIDVIVESIRTASIKAGKPFTKDHEMYFRMGISYGFPLVSKVTAVLPIDKIAFVDFMIEMEKEKDSNNE